MDGVLSRVRGASGVDCTLGEGTAEVGCTLGEGTVGVDCTLGDGVGLDLLFVCGAVARRRICDIWMNLLEVREPYVRPVMGDVFFCKIASISVAA